MDNSFQDLLVRYANGDCTAEEIGKINWWYEEIGDKELQLDEVEKRIMKTRMLANIRKALPDHHKPLGKRLYLLAHPLIYYWLIAPRETDCFGKQEVSRTLSKTLREGLLGGINNNSRMMREYHVRICEKLGGKFPGFTRRFIHFS